LVYNLTVGTYVGVNTCALCHSGGVIASNMVSSWQKTLHSHVFADSLDGALGTHINQSCSQCHATGYDVNTNAVNGGFDDIASQIGWTFPTVLTNGNWAAVPQALKDISNVQCESCHGPGSEHAAALGNANVSNWPRLSVTVSSGDCNQCHDATTITSRALNGSSPVMRTPHEFPLAPTGLRVWRVTPLTDSSQGSIPPQRALTQLMPRLAARPAMSRMG
jgi:hypothetical protein